MRNKKDIDQEVVELSTLRDMVKVYGEVASNRMNTIRQSVLFSRGFLEQIQEVFYQSRRSYMEKIRSERRLLGGKKNITVLPHNGLTVAVFLSSNTRLYGDLVWRTYEEFIKDVKQGSEATIVGRVGVNFYKDEMGDRPYTFFEFPDYEMDEGKLKELVHHLVQYEKINVYYGKFKNVMQQEPVKYTISATVTETQETDKGELVAYLYEPSLEMVLQFFEQEIFGTLFDQTIRESQLAKLASRLVAMDRAEQNITDKIHTTELERLKVMHRLSNRKQLNAMSSVLMRFWG